MLPVAAIEKTRTYFAVILFGLVTFSSVWVMLATKFKLDKTIQLMIYGYVLLFAARLIQSLTDSLDETASSAWDVIIVVLFELIWGFMYYFVCEMQIVRILLRDPEVSSEEED